MPVIDSLFAELGFEFDDENLEKFNEGFKDASKLMLGFIAGAAAAQAAILAFTKQIAVTNDETGKFSEITGIALDNLQELGFVAELNGGSLDSMNTSLSNLSKTASEAARGMGGNVETFGMLGVALMDDNNQLKETDVLLNDISDALAGLGTQAEKLEFASKLGIGEDLLLSLQDGSEALMQQRKEARELGFVIDQDAAKAAADFNDNLLRMQKIFQGITSVIGTKLMKQMKPMNDLFIKWFKLNKDIIQQNVTLFLEKVSKATNAVFNVLKRVYDVLINVVRGFGGWENAIKIAIGSLIALNASLLLTPALIITAGAAILLIIEDIQKFAEGGDSALGDLIQKIPELEAPLMAILGIIKSIGEGWALIFGPEGKQFVQGIKEEIDELADSVRDLLDLLGLLEKDVTRSAATDKGNFFKDLKLFEGWSLDNLKDAFSSLTRGEAVDTSIAANVGLLPAQRIRNDNKQNNIFNINGGNPAEVEATVRRVLGDEYRASELNMSTPVTN